MRNFLRKRGNFVATSVAFIILVFMIDTGMKAYAQSQQKKNEIKEEETYTRPQPSRPIQPEIPDVNRYQEDKVFLEYADSLYKINSRDTVEKQILKGNVKFRQAGLWMFCDSAYYYPTQNSLDAFSNVKMEQGDTLFVYSDQLFYDGNLHLAKLKNGPTRDKVLLINKDVTLTTDSLDYDMAIDLGWYSRWGTIDDKVNVLTSLYGEYSPKTKRAEFFKDVVLENNKDGFTMYTDTLYYSTETHIANIESRTQIVSANDTIFTNLATYYTDTGDADLLSRSLIIHRDSTGNVTTLEGDSIIYDNTTRVSRAYMFRDPFKRSTPMVITDTAQKTTLIGGFGLYNDSTKEALATIYPLLMEYSQGDTLFLRADTIKTILITEMIPDTRRRTKSGLPEFEGIPIVRADTLGLNLWIDSAYFKLRIPYVETPLLSLLKAAPPAKKEEPQKEEPSTVDKISPLVETLEDADLSPEEILDSVANIESQKVASLLDKVANMPSDSLKSANFEIKAVMPDSLDLDSVFGRDLNFSPDPEIFPVLTGDSIRQSQDSIASIEELKEIEEKDTVPKIPYQYHVVLAYHRGRFFKQDMQGVADSIVFVEKDSMLYLFRKPIVWSGERQVTGNRIDVHFNDSTTDWAYLPEYGLMSEHVEEEFYNQIFGKEIMAYFEGQGLKRMSVSGNVETIFLPQESDSTYNRLVNAESSYMDVYLNENNLDWLKMWPEVSGSVTPIFLVKRNQLYLQKFKWWGFLRPEREWYGDRIKWADNLGEVPDELEQYFLSPSDFGEPKSFSGTRVDLPPSSLPALTEEEEGETVSDILDYSLSLEEESMETEIQTNEIEEEVEEEESTESQSVNEESKVALPVKEEATEAPPAKEEVKSEEPEKKVESENKSEPEKKKEPEKGKGVSNE